MGSGRDPGSRSLVIPLFARSLFRSSSLTESLEQAKSEFITRVLGQIMRDKYAVLAKVLETLRKDDVSLRASSLFGSHARFIRAAARGLGRGRARESLQLYD